MKGCVHICHKVKGTPLTWVSATCKAEGFRRQGSCAVYSKHSWWPVQLYGPTTLAVLVPGCQQYHL